MTQRHFAGAAAAFAVLLTLILPAAGFENTGVPDPDPAWRDAGSLDDLAGVLDDWLDANSDYPRNPAPLAIEIADPITIAMNPSVASSFGSRTRGLYDPEAGRIYLIAPWSRKDALDVSVLLHELVHHRQIARHWYCPAAQEPDAYTLQQAWLAERGLEADIDRVTIVLAAGCTPRDIHPD
ncbi:DUF6647 family protein [Oricola indica]|jgi:hypothetical protein|uniref:DUF6647 family protein n=1 Tax=Oricola indica TaxID=2872591 RepID=UPI001CBEAF0C|nr:DUF6647 family protein [Oricola indica]